jgi:hypothetical protein
MTIGLVLILMLDDLFNQFLELIGLIEWKYT